MNSLSFIQIKLESEERVNTWVSFMKLGEVLLIVN